MVPPKKFMSQMKQKVLARDNRHDDATSSPMGEVPHREHSGDKADRKIDDTASFEDCEDVKERRIDRSGVQQRLDLVPSIDLSGIAEGLRTSLLLINEFAEHELVCDSTHTKPHLQLIKGISAVQALLRAAEKELSAIKKPLGYCIHFAKDIIYWGGKCGPALSPLHQRLLQQVPTIQELLQTAEFNLSVISNPLDNGLHHARVIISYAETCCQQRERMSERLETLQGLVDVQEKYKGLQIVKDPKQGNKEGSSDQVAHDEARETLRIFKKELAEPHRWLSELIRDLQMAVGFATKGCEASAGLTATISIDGVAQMLVQCQELFQKLVPYYRKASDRGQLDISSRTWRTGGDPFENAKFLKSKLEEIRGTMRALEKFRFFTIGARLCGLDQIIESLDTKHYREESDGKLVDHATAGKDWSKLLLAASITLNQIQDCFAHWYIFYGRSGQSPANEADISTNGTAAIERPPPNPSMRDIEHVVDAIYTQIKAEKLLQKQHGQITLGSLGSPGRCFIHEDGADMSVNGYERALYIHKGAGHMKVSDASNGAGSVYVQDGRGTMVIGKGNKGAIYIQRGTGTMRIPDDNDGSFYRPTGTGRMIVGDEDLPRVEGNEYIVLDKELKAWIHGGD